MYLILQEAAQEAAQHTGEAGCGTNLLSPNGGLMVWTLVIFVLLWIVLSIFAIKPITKAVEVRERAL